MAPSEDDPTTHSSSVEEDFESESEPDKQLVRPGIPAPDESSSEDDESSAEEVSESESEPEPDKQLVRPDIPAPDVSSSESGSESESDPESESDSDQSTKISGERDPAIKPINPPEAVTEPSLLPPPLAVKSGSKEKRPALDPKNETPESKKAKKDGDDTEDGAKKLNGDDTKKILFQRVWSEEDEIVILQGMTDFTAKYEVEPISDMNSFYGFVKKSLHVDFTKTQLADKVRRLKRKFLNKCKKQQTGKEITFSKPHEQICYNLSKKIWGSNGGEDSNVKVDNTKSNVTWKRYQMQRNGSILVPLEVDEADKHKEVTAIEVDAEVQPIGPVLSGGSIVLSDSVDQMIENGWKLVDGSKKSEWKKKLKKLTLEELELYEKRLELKHEQMKLVSEAMTLAQE